VKKEEDTAKEAFDGGALAQFFGCPGGRQAGAVLLSGAGSRGQPPRLPEWHGESRMSFKPQ